ncbi:gyrA [Symbiodinium natans]|uniref:GyrA protein n=1 Tax=Symbiodinium natans TaxID=878477 RepID=A0A812NLK9_9DINO|nr:gyrA [Symbiodinium natans]
MQDAYEKADAEDDDEADMDDVRSNVPTEASPPASPRAAKTGEVSASLQQFLEAHSVLIINEKGFGKRVRLSDVKLSNRNAVGQKLRLQEESDVAAICVVPSDVLPQLPPRPRDAPTLYKDSLAKARAEAIQAAAARGEEVEDEPAEVPFDCLSETAQKDFVDQQQRDEEAFKAAREARQEAEKVLRPKLGAVLLCTSGGLVLRLHILHVRVMKRRQKATCLMKVPRSDKLISASLLSAVDHERDDAAIGEEQEEAAPQEAEEDEADEDDDEENE